MFPNSVSNMAFKKKKKKDLIIGRKDREITWLGGFIGCHGKQKSLTLRLVCFRGKTTTKMPFFMTTEECFPNNHL